MLATLTGLDRHRKKWIRLMKTTAPVVVILGCTASTSDTGTDPVDTGPDAGPDSGPEAGTDSGPDAAPDAETTPDPITTTAGVTGGGGRMSSNGFNARISIGSPVPVGSAQSPNHRVQIGTGHSQNGSARERAGGVALLRWALLHLGTPALGRIGAHLRRGALRHARRHQVVVIASAL